MRRAAFALLLVAAVAGCGAFDAEPASTTTTSRSPVATTSTTSTSTSEAGATTGLLVYFLRNAKVGAAERTVPATPGVAAAAVGALLRGPTGAEVSAGLTSAIPAGTQLQRVAVDAGTATVDLSTSLPAEAVAQVVYTVTQFPTVARVVVGAGVPAVGRADLEALTPAILIEHPTPGVEVASPVHVSGTANVFEGTLHVQLLDTTGAVLADQVVTATSGSGTRGTFEATLTWASPARRARLVVFTDSPRDGSRQDIVDVPLQLARTG